MNCSNAGSETIASDVDLPRRNSNARSKSSRNNEKYVVNIIDLLIQTSTLEKEKSKDYLWKEVAVKLMWHLRNDSEEKNNENQNAFIAKNVQKLKTFVQLLSKQLQTQDSTRFSSRITSWVNVTREEATMKEQRLRDELSSLRKNRKIIMKITERKKVKKIQKKFIEQILQEITNVLTAQRNLIMSFRKLESEDITLHAVSSKTRANLKRSQTWAKEIVNLTRIMHQIFAVLAHEIHITIDTSNQKVIIKRLIKDNTRLYENLKILRIVWLKKVIESEKIHLSLIIKIAIEAMMNWLMNESMLNLYQDSRMFMQIVWNELLHHSMLQMLNSARRNNAALNAQINITLKSAWCLWIKDVASTATKIMNSENTFVSNDDSRWNKHQKSTETDQSNIWKHWNIIIHFSCCFRTL